MIPDPLAEQQQAFGPYKMMLMMDPPQHTAFRKLIRKEFTLPVAADRKPRMQALARQIVDAVIEKGECDFVDEVAGEMPSFVIAELMGLPLDDGRELYKLTEIIHTAPEALPPGAGGAGGDEDVRVRPQRDRREARAAERRPGDQAAAGRGRRQAARRHRVPAVLPAAGRRRRRHDAQPALRRPAGADGESGPARLADGRPRRAAAIAREELLRWTSPVIYMRRTARHDIDARRREDPRRRQGGDVFRLRQPRSRRSSSGPTSSTCRATPNEHIAFGTGPHGCLGQHIARIEIDAMLREVLTRMDDFELAGARSGCRPTSSPARNGCRFVSALSRNLAGYPNTLLAESPSKMNCIASAASRMPETRATTLAPVNPKTRSRP